MDLSARVPRIKQPIRVPTMRATLGMGCFHSSSQVKSNCNHNTLILNTYFDILLIINLSNNGGFKNRSIVDPSVTVLHIIRQICVIIFYLSYALSCLVPRSVVSVTFRVHGSSYVCYQPIRRKV